MGCSLLLPHRITREIMSLYQHGTNNMVSGYNNKGLSSLLIQCLPTYQLQSQSKCKMNNKSKKKTQSELAIDALAHASKSVLALATCLVSFFADFHIVIFIISLLPLLYFTFIAIQQNAFITLFKYFRKALKFRKIHSFFEEIQTAKPQLPIKPFFDRGTPIKHRKHHHHLEKSEKSPEKSEVKISDKPIYVPPPKEKVEDEDDKFIMDYTLPEKEEDKKEYEKFYLSHRDRYKASFEQIFGKQQKREDFEAVVDRIHSFYMKRVSELLLMNRINLKQLKQELQKHYQVYILENQTVEKSKQLVNVTIDQAVDRIHQFREKESFPWIEKMDCDAAQVKAHFEKILRISRDRKEIDRFLAPYYPLNQQSREEVANKLEHQLEHPHALGKELTYTVAEIYNDKLIVSKISADFSILKQGITSKPCLKILQVRVGSHLHLDLQIQRSNKAQTVNCNPGDSNLWTLIGFAVEILKRKL